MGARDATATTLNIQPVAPFALTKDWNVILRVIMPLVSQPTDDGLRINGMSDTLTTAFLSPSKLGKVIWGAGPVLMLPTATNNALGNEQVGLGPSIVALVEPGRWTTGILWNQVWSVGGADDRADVNQGFFQPFVNYECATIGQVLQDNGYSTFWLGKNHNVPTEDIASGASRSEWPLQKGFDRFYGFLGGETNNWYPDLVDDNKFIDQPYTPEQGYHLSKDVADQATRMLRDQKSTNPSKPWFMWFCPGANHAPHHSPKEYADKYKGKFDDGYEAYREWALPRMIEKGILPKDTKLTPLNPMPTEVAATAPADAVRPWDSLSADEQKLFARMVPRKGAALHRRQGRSRRPDEDPERALHALRRRPLRRDSTAPTR